MKYLRGNHPGARQVAGPAAQGAAADFDVPGDIGHMDEGAFGAKDVFLLPVEKGRAAARAAASPPALRRLDRCASRVRSSWTVWRTHAAGLASIPGGSQATTLDVRAALAGMISRITQARKAGRVKPGSAVPRKK